MVKPENKPNTSVKTGDNTNSIGFVMLLGVSAAYIFMIERKKLQ